MIPAVSAGIRTSSRMVSVYCSRGSSMRSATHAGNSSVSIFVAGRSTYRTSSRTTSVVSSPEPSHHPTPKPSSRVASNSIVLRCAIVLCSVSLKKRRAADRCSGVKTFKKPPSQQPNSISVVPACGCSPCNMRYATTCNRSRL